MSFSEQFQKKINSDVETWKQKDDELKAEIERQKGLAEQFQAAVDADMEQGPASPKTAENALNVRYAKQRQEKAQEQLAQFEAAPLYTVDQYNELCDGIRDEYKARVNKKLDELGKVIDNALQLLDDVHALAKEANNCDKEIRQAIADCGKNPKECLTGSHYDNGHGPGYWVEPTFRTTRTEKALQEAQKDLGAKL